MALVGHPPLVGDSFDHLGGCAPALLGGLGEVSVGQFLEGFG